MAPTPAGSTMGTSDGAICLADASRHSSSRRTPTFTEVLRYVVLNPVRAKMVEGPETYRWSSYRATAGLDAPPEWLDTQAALSPFSGLSEAGSADYPTIVAEKIGCEPRLLGPLIYWIF